MLFIQVAVVLAVLAVAFAERDPRIMKQVTAKRLSVQKAKPSHRKISQSDVKKVDIPTTYLSISNYEETAACTGNPVMMMGLAFDQCIVGEVDPVNGSPLTSVKYYKDPAGAVFMSYFSDTGDCTGTSADNNVVVPTPCINNNMLVTAVDSSTPYNAITESGVVVSFFNSAEECAAGGSGYDFLWYSSTFCVPDAAEDGSYLSYKYTGCDANGVSVTYYTDNSCTNVLNSAVTPLLSCMESTNNMQPAWISQACSTPAVTVRK